MVQVLQLVRELELYVSAGFTTSEALAAATITPAHLVGVDKTTGSITVGKSADLVLVEGDPSQRIGDLRNTRTIMMDGKLMDADALREPAVSQVGQRHPIYTSRSFVVFSSPRLILSIGRFLSSRVELQQTNGWRYEDE